MRIVEGFMHACDTTLTTLTASWSRRGYPAAASRELGQEHINGKTLIVSQGKKVGLPSSYYQNRQDSLPRVRPRIDPHLSAISFWWLRRRTLQAAIWLLWFWMVFWNRADTTLLLELCRGELQCSVVCFSGYSWQAPALALRAATRVLGWELRA